MGTATFSDVQKVSVGGSNMACLATLTGSSSYATGGDALNTNGLPFVFIDSILLAPLSETTEYILSLDNSTIATPLIKFSTVSGTITGGTIGSTSAGTPAGTNGTSAVTGTAAAQTFTGTASTTGEVTAFSGTGQSSAGQVITTTDNQTMTLNQCAGMWFVSATHGPYYIVSNTAVSGAQAVLTVIGDAPTTDAGEYRIVKAPTPAGTNGASASLTATAAAQTFTGSAMSTHTHTVSGLSGSAAISEITATTDLSTTTFRVLVFGHN